MEKMAVIETSGQLKQFTNFVDCNKDFKHYLQDRYPDAVFLENVAEDEIKTNDLFNCGSYLLKNGNRFYLIEKSEHVNRGYIYNCNEIRSEIVHSWELYPCKTKVEVGAEASAKAVAETDEEKDEGTGIFNMDEMVESPFINIIGKKVTERYSIIDKILDKYGEEQLKNTMIISPKGYLKSKYRQVKIKNEYHSYLIKNLLEEQEKRVVEFQTGCSLGKNFMENFIKEHGATIILDQCLDHRYDFDSDYFKQLFINGKLYGITVIVTQQYAQPFPPDLRLLFDYIFMMEENYLSHLKMLYKNYGNDFGTEEEFIKYFNSLGKTLVVQYDKDLSGGVSHNKGLSQKLFTI